jgi:predicted phage terminase large subunit-like protein
MRTREDLEARAAALAIRKRRIDKARAKRSLLPFTEWTFPSYEASWHHRLLASKLDAVARGEILRLLVFMPPQHGKSELISRSWPSQLLGQNPDLRIIATSYNDDLAEYNARIVRRRIKSAAFRELFPARALIDRTVKRGDYVDRVSHFEIPGHDGYYLSAGIMAGMTGYGFDVGIIDDPIKNAQEADSPAYRERLKAAFHGTFETRGRGMAGPDGIPDRIVGVFTRWHEDDLGGYLVELGKASGDPWEVLSLPAILDVDPVGEDPREHGEALWPARYPAELLAKRKRNTPARTWDAMYQQRPAPAEGGVFKRRWWRFKPAAERPEFDFLFMSWDLAFKDTGTSRVAGIVFGVHGADLYVLDVVVDFMSYVESKEAVRALARRWPDAYWKLVEDKANGPALINDLGSEIGGLTPWPPKGEALDSKQARWNAATPPVACHNVYLPPSLEAVWVDGFIAELAALPNGAHDDQADAFAQGVNFWRTADASFLEGLTHM